MQQSNRHMKHAILIIVLAIVSLTGSARNTNPDYQSYKYGGKEFQHAHGLDLYDFLARQYDPATGLFTSMDPLCEKYYHISPYAYCAGNPVNAVDPDGKNPIFDKYGKLMGVDDWGLKGDAIFMNRQDFSYKLTHEDALKMDLGVSSLVDDKAKEKYEKTYNNLPNRPDWDGHITLSEANDWYRNGKGETLYADLELINLSGIVSLGDKYVGVEKTFNLLLGGSLSINDGLVYGNMRLKRYPGNTVRAYSDIYDFDMKSWKNPLNWMRNIETLIGKFYAGKGTPYEIIPYGNKKLKTLFPWQK
ncbi:MAG: RHS repeat-associated core domain-containing protein [Bacteroidaceae bacterium]|nr:RHS repeat-associated core domain-containing protein [Bacteroidaceae bacterium]